METHRKQIGNRISKRRKVLHMTQAYVAEYLDCSNNTLSSIERGQQGITVETLLKLCECLDTTPNHLLLGNRHPNDIPMDILDTLRLCTEEQVRLTRDFVEMLYSNKHIDF